jgi:hypothetical protein
MSTWTTEDRKEAEKIMNNEPALKGEPVAWAMKDKDGNFYDCISPEEHDRHEGSYTIPLYTHPADVDAIDTSEQYVDKTQNNRHELTDEEIALTWNEFSALQSPKDIKDFARAILRKAQEK